MNTDPGWKPILLNPGNLLLPAFARMGRQGASPILLARLLFSMFILTVYVYMPFVLAFLFDEWTDIDTTHAAGLGILSVGVFLVARWVTRRPARSDNPIAAWGEYRSRMFLAIALAEMIALGGFVLTFLNNSTAAYALAAILAIPAFVMAAPTVSSVARFAGQTTDPDAFLAAMTVAGRPSGRTTH
jgi:hypothetical protein